MADTAGWKQFYPEICVANPELTPERVSLIQVSYAKITDRTAPGLVGRDEEFFGRRFYEILFATHPELRPLFKDTRAQARKLTAILRKMTGLLDKDVDAVAKELTQLAKRHERYGTEPAHYAVICGNLSKALKESLGDQMDAKTAEAWVHLYSVICQIMIPITYELVHGEKK